MLASRYQDYMFGLLKKVIDEIGPRPSCSEAEKKLGRLLVEEWKSICDRVDVESFRCSPTASLGSLYLVVLLYLGAVILYWFLPPLALALAAVSCSIVVLEVFRMQEFVDFLFPRKQGENVIGSIRPNSEPAQRVIVCAHMDSQYEWNLFYYLKGASLLVMVVGILAVAIAFGGSVAKTLAYCNVFSSDAVLRGVGIAMIALSPIAGLFLLFTSWKPVPGAWDDMSGVSVVAGLGGYLAEAKRSGEWFPERTEVVLLATSTEEGGIRGSKRYVRGHLRDLKAIPTYCLNVDGAKSEKSLAVIKGEFLIGARHDPKLVKMAQEVAASHNWPTSVKVSVNPGGSSDAARFSLSGIPAVWFGFRESSKWDRAYHTRYDTYDSIRPEGLSAALQLVIDMIQRIDKK